MKKIGIDELRQIQLNILKNVHQFCEERNLKYSLGGGSLLGAVRHKGYIPWDDDIDIMMPRPDYNIFVKEFNGYIEHLVCGAYENNKNFTYPFAKIYDTRTYFKEKRIKEAIGINIDLFPIDGFPDKGNEKEFNRFIKKVKFLRRLYILKIDQRWFVRLLGVVLLFTPLSMIQKMISQTIQTYKFEDSKFIGAVIGLYNEKECYPREVFEKYINLEFEGEYLYAIKNYDEYLKGHYGDYMELPPVDKQIGHHKGEVYLE